MNETKHAEEKEIRAAESSPNFLAVKEESLKLQTDLVNIPQINQIGQYNLVEEIASTNIGKLYRALNQSVEKQFALKLISKEFCTDPSTITRFKQEAKTACELSSPYICSVYDYGIEENGSAYLVTDFLNGISLKELLAKDGFLSVERFFEIFRQVCEGLRYLHKHNLLHRNLKPSNIFLINTDNDTDYVKVVDFGIARILNQNNSKKAENGDLIGNPNYMSPEQVMGYKLDSRTDIYSLGLIMYECITGKPAFPGNNQIQTIVKQLNSRPRSFRTIAPEMDIPESIERLIMRCLEKNRVERYESIEELESDLEIAATTINIDWENNLNANNSFSMSKKKNNNPKINFSRSKTFSYTIIALILVGISVLFFLRVQYNLKSMFHPYHVSPAYLNHIQETSITRLITQAEEYLNEMNYKEARQLYSQALSTLELKSYLTQTESDTLFMILSRLGQIYLNSNDYTNNEIIDEVQPGFNSDLGHTTRLFQPGENHANKSVPTTFTTRAEQLLLQAYHMKENNLTLEDSSLLDYLASAHYQAGHSDLAAKVTKKTIDLIQEQTSSGRDYNYLISRLHNLAFFYADMGQYDLACKTWSEGLILDSSINKPTNSSNFAKVIKTGLATTFLKMGEYEQAAKLAQNNLNILDSNQDKDKISNNLIIASKAYRELYKQNHNKKYAKLADKLELDNHRLKPDYLSN